MRAVVTLLFLVLNGQIAIAEPRIVQPAHISINIASVERIITLTHQRGEPARVQLVQTDNGGSSDMSAYLEPSSLYLTVFKQAEEQDLSASYLLFDDLTAVQSTNYDKNQQVITLVTTHRSENPGQGIGLAKRHSRISLAKLIKQIGEERRQEISQSIVIERSNKK